MAITRVRATPIGENSAAAASQAVSFGALPAAGNTIIVEVAYDPATATPLAAWMTDNQGNTYQLAVGSAVNGTVRTAIYYAENIGTPSGTFTVTFTPAVNSFFAMMAVEWAGLATSSSIDQTNSNFSTSSPAAVTTGTTTQANELVVAVFGNSQSGNTAITKDAAFTEDFVETNGAVFQASEGSYQIVSATGAYTSTWTMASGAAWTCSIATFKQAAAAAGGPFPPWPANPMRSLLAQ